MFTKKSSVSPRVARIKEPSVEPCHAGEHWRVRLLRDDLFGTDEIEIRGFRIDGASLPPLRISVAERSNIRTFVRELDSRSARIPNHPQRRMDFVASLIRSTPTEAVIATTKPGFRNKGTGFVTPSKMYGTAKGRYAWTGDNETTLGQRRGTLDTYRKQVLKPIVSSPLLCLGVMCALAASLPSYLLQRTGSKIISETMIFFFHGLTTTGKSTISRLASSVYGLPNEGIDWAATDRAVAEAAYYCNDLLTLIDDTEKCEEQDRGLCHRVRIMGQRLPAGESKTISIHAQKKGLPHLRWTSIGLTSGPIASSVLAARAGIQLHGQVVRFFDIAVPEHGVGAFGQGDQPDEPTKHNGLMERLNKGLAENYGTLLGPWIELLLKRDRSSKIRARVDWFVKKYADPSNAVSMRIASKIGLLYAAGRIAQRAGLLPWPNKRPQQVAKYVYEKIIRELAPRDHSLDDLIGKLRRAFNDSQMFPARASKSRYVKLGRGAVGLHIRTSRADRWLLHPTGLTKFGIHTDHCTSVCRQLLERGLIIRGHNSSGTVQERVVGDDGRIKKMRFWVLDIDKLREAES